MKQAFQWLSLRRPIARFGLGISPGGVAFLIGTSIIGLAAVDANINLLMLIFGFCIGAAMLSLFTGWRTLRGLEVRRQVPDILVAGQPCEIRYTITNPGRWGMARQVHVLDLLPAGVPIPSPETYVAALPSGEAATRTVTIVPKARGRIGFSRVYVATRFPFGIFRKQISVARPCEVVVFPPLGRLLSDVRAASQSSDASTGGGSPAKVHGDEEYYGVREYRVGDNPRRIHWRRTARTGQLMIREMTRTRDQQLWCVLDTRIDKGDAAQIDRLEAAISCVATVVCEALEHGIKVGLVCGGEPFLVLPPGGGRAHRPRLLRELATRNATATDELRPHIERLGWPVRWRGPCLLFAAAESNNLRRTMWLLSRALGPTTTYIPDTAAFEAFFSRTAPAVAAGAVRGRSARMGR
ncbi:MAG TPA: DUF58 domain-containing protein [Phycisphaerae bacterium]|nr:DUF58 domain-containing protein [Phycisphaerae bacterium]